MLSLFEYFEVLKDPLLPDSNGLLSNVIDREAIEAANEEVILVDKG